MGHILHFRVEIGNRESDYSQNQPFGALYELLEEKSGKEMLAVRFY